MIEEYYFDFFLEMENAKRQQQTPHGTMTMESVRGG
jgi:hypothetical protein